MNLTHIYHTTSTTETLEAHIYIDSYTDKGIKDLIHRYKFTQDTEAQSILTYKTLDLCIDRYISSHCAGKTLYICTSPPSTMFERGEKSVDSMFELIVGAMRIFPQYVHIPKHSHIGTSKIFNIYTQHLKQKRAQHIDGSRRSRIKNIEQRYYISLKHKLYLWYVIHIRKMNHITYSIIDDVSSTGATLVACKHTLLTYLKRIQKKNPHISFDVIICSLTH